MLHARLFQLKHQLRVRPCCRDLKPENLLLTSKDDDADMKLADFGFAVKADGDNVDAQLGTPGYIAPEILENKKYGAWPYSLLL